MHTKVLSQYVSWRMGNPIIDVKCGSNRVKFAIIKGQQVLVLVIKALNGVRLALGEIPDVPYIEDVDFILAILIDCRDQDLASVNVTPLGLQMHKLHYTTPLARRCNVLLDASAAPSVHPSSDVAELMQYRDLRASRLRLVLEPSRR